MLNYRKGIIMKNLHFNDLFQLTHGIHMVHIIPLYEYLTKTGWWYTYPSEKYEFVSWDYESFPTEWKVIKFHGSSHHQPAMVLATKIGADI